MKQLSGLIGLTIIILLSLGSCNSRMSNEDVLKAYLENHNEHNIDETMELFHERAVVHLPGQPPLRDVRKIEAWDAAVQSRKQYESWEVKGDTIIIGTITEKNSWYSHAGIRQVTYEPGTMFVFKDGKILRIQSANMTAESQELIQDMFRNFLNWAQANKPAEITRLMPGGQINLDEENSREWFLLMDEWQRTR